MNTDRAAYLPSFPTCNDFCKKISYQGRSVFVAHIDQSGGANDISYDAYNFLITGQSAAQNPITGGGQETVMDTVAPENCASIFEGGKVAFSASTGSAFPASCPINTYIGRNHALYNIQTATCTWGRDESCWLDDNHQPHCPSQMNLPARLTSRPAYNTQYGTGQRYVAQ